MGTSTIINTDGDEIEIKSPIEGWHVYMHRKMICLSDHPEDERGMSYTFTAYLVNPGDHDWKKGLFEIWFGAHAATHFLVWAQGFEDALEEAAEAALDAGMKGFFVDDENMKELYDEARKELGPDADDDDVAQQAEADLTYTESGWMPSYEWGGQDVHPGAKFGDGGDLYAATKAVSEAYSAEPEEELEENAGRTNKRGKQLWPGTWVRVYRDDPKKGLDNWTAVFDGKEWNASVNGRNRMMLGMDESTRGFSQWTEGEEGRHLGKEIPWDQVPEQIRRHIEARGNPEHNQNARGGIDYSDYAIRERGGRFYLYSFNAYKDSWGGLLESARGYDSERAAYEAARKHAHRVGHHAGVVVHENARGSVTQIGSVGTGGEYNPNARGAPIDETAATELDLYISNTYELVAAPNSIGQSIKKNLERKIAKGTFDPELSVKAWEYLVEAGAKAYAKEFGEAKDWHTMFSPATRRYVAQGMAKEFAEGIEREVKPLLGRLPAKSMKENGASERFLAKKYGLTNSEATRLAQHPHRDQVIDQLDQWRDKHGLPAADSALSRGKLRELIR